MKKTRIKFLDKVSFSTACKDLTLTVVTLTVDRVT